MKFNFNFSIPETKSGEVVLFPGLQCNLVVEHDKEEFLALLPHYEQMAKIIIPHIETLRAQALQFVKDAAAAVGPELLALGKQAVDVWSEGRRISAQESKLDRELEREIRRARDLNDLKVRGM